MTSGDGGVPEDGSTPGPDGSTGRDGGPRPDGSVPPVEGCGGDVVGLVHEITSVAGVYTGREHHGVIQRSTNRLVAFGEQISPALARFPYVQLDEVGGAVHVAHVEGDVPAGQVYHAVWHSGLDRFVLLTLERDPFRYALYTMELTATTARFTRLDATGTPPGDGLVFAGLYPLGGSGLAAQRGEEAFTIEVSGASATWSAPMPATNEAHAVEVSDPEGGRLIAFGEYHFDPATGTASVEPRVFTRSLPSGGWSEVPAFGGDAPPVIEDGLGGGESFAAYDASVDRLFVTVGRLVHDPIFEEDVWQTGLWSLDLGTGTWQLVADPFWDTGYSYGTAWAVDETNHRILALAAGGISALRSDGPEIGRVEPLTLDGYLGPADAQGATALEDGRLVAATRDGSLVVFDPADPDGRWERLGEATLPYASRVGLSLHRDPVTGDLLAFGGGTSFGGEATATLQRVEADGSAVAEDVIAGAPPARYQHGALVRGETLYVAGGYDGSGYLDDVWALDLRARSWRRLATLPSGRSRPALLVVGDELWVAGGYEGDAGATDVTAIAIADGSTRTVSVSGAGPARAGIFYGAVPFAGGLVAFDLVDDTIDGTVPQLFFLEPVGADARWTALGGCFVDRLVYEAIGVPIDDAHASMVGPEVFSLR